MSGQSEMLDMERTVSEIHSYMSRERTLCPYTLKSLSELPETSREHIFPDAIGGPANYSVQADKRENSWFGTNVDALFNDCHLIRLARTILGIKGKNRIPDFRLRGETVDSGRPVNVTIFHDKPPKRSFVKPYTFDPQNQRGDIIVDPDKTESEMMRYEQIFAKKGQRINFHEPKVMEAEPVSAALEADLSVLRAGVLKVAYLAAFEVLGDGFLRDPLNSEWQKGIRATTPESRAGIELCGTCPLLREQGVQYPLPNLEKHQHFVSILCDGSFPFVFVELFGCEALTCCCWLSITSNLGMGNGEAHLVLCDAVAKSVDRSDHT